MAAMGNLGGNMMSHYMDRSSAVRGSGYNTMINPHHSHMGMMGNSGTQVVHFPSGDATPVNVTVRKSENVQPPAKIEVHAGAETGPVVEGAAATKPTAAQAGAESGTEAKPAATSAAESDSESE